MGTDPLFKYSLNFKVFTFAGIVLTVLITLSALAIRFGFTYISIYWWIISIIVIFGISLVLFLRYVTYPLENISKQILLLLVGKKYENILPKSNDEIGVVTHFFNTVTDKIKSLSDDLSKGKRMSSELDVAKRIQRDVFPKESPENIVGLDIVAKTKSSSEIGGDCFDFVEQEDDTLVYIGDVTGHGVPASLVMMIVNTVIRTLAKQKISPKDILDKTNFALKEKIATNHYMSLTMLHWKNLEQKMSYIGAGHEYILHYSAKDKKVNTIKSGGIALKMIPDISKILKETEIDFREGDVILLYTDGITEAKNKQGQMYGLERLTTALAQHAYRKAPDIFDKVTEDYSKFLGPNPRQIDDVTMIIIKNIGQHEEAKKIVLSIKTSEELPMIDQAKAWGWD